jgi:hypothetical protein
MHVMIVLPSPGYEHNMNDDEIYISVEDNEYF